ncbi:MAG: hypothetical protein MUC92_03880 [Fimbriimonadaceae bacterium]|jgi:processive 1,2-diacylglycerol beta-glucosyltransferase|nr:hypothetical protein [Fimbriimonadaceae bacterium]
MRLLVLSASTGNGHVSAANAISEEALSRGWKSESVDVLDHTGRGFAGWYRGGYEQLVRKTPRTWGHLYKTSDRPLFNYWFQTGLDVSFCRRVRPLIKSLRPDWVVCTHSLPQPQLALLRKEFGFRVAIVVTDLYPHRMWLRGNPDWFFVPQEWSRQVLETRLPSAKGRITVTGIPINRVFATHYDRESLRRSAELQPTDVQVLITSGGIGGGPVLDLAQGLQGSSFRKIYIAGRNHRLEANLRQMLATDQSSVVKGHVAQAEMAELMAMSDLLVAKPGGLTTFEALAQGLPFVVYLPFLIPGQEEGNAEYLSQIGAGTIVKRFDQLHEELQRLADSRELRVKMRDAGLSQAKPNAVVEIVDELGRL